MTGKPKYTPEQIEQMSLLQQQGLTLEQISQQLSIPKESIRGSLARHGIRVRSNYRTPPVDYSYVEPWWMQAFAGLFYGEGNLGLYANQMRSNRTNEPLSRKHIYPTLNISLRDDDTQLLNDVQAKLGGHLTYHTPKPPRHRYVRWAIRGWKSVHGLLLVWPEQTLPSRKLEEIKLLREACELRRQLSFCLSPDEYALLDGYRVALSNMKHY